MVDAARQMLDELMGRNRNLHPSEAGHKVNWEDPGFCQFYNVKFCPHDLFINTRADLGPCTRIHDDEAKHLYIEAKSTQRKRQYEDEFLRFCNVMLHDVDRKIQKGKQRLLLMQSDQPVAHVPVAVTKLMEQLNTLNARIGKLLTEAEEAGIRGDVDQAQDLMTICEELKDEKDLLQKQYDDATKPSQRSTTFSTSPDTCDKVSGTNVENDEQSNDGLHRSSSNASLVEGTNESNEADDTNPSDDNERKTQTPWTLEMNTVPEKQMKVCEICGAFLIVGDAQQRIEDHLMGKQHLGYSKLRNAVAEINDRRQRDREAEERRRREERSQRGNAFDHRRDQRDYRDRSRDYGGGGGSGGSSSSSGNRHQSDKHRYHHKSHHRSSHSHSRNSRSSGGGGGAGGSSRHQNYYVHSNERSRSRSRY